MHIPVTSVCVEGLTLHELQTGAEKYALTKRLHELAGGTYGKFPGPSPVSIDRGDYTTLKNAPYVVCEKTDGWRACLMFTRFKGLQLSVIFDRKLTPYIIRIHKVPSAIWQGSVFDGEVVLNIQTQKWGFLMFDALRVSGIPIGHRTFTQRLAVAHKAWGPYTYTGQEEDSLEIRLKTFLPREDLGALPGHMANVSREFKTDGIVITPDIPGIVYGRHRGLFKLKTVHSVDFLVDQSGKGLCVYDSQARMHVKVGILAGRKLATVGSIVECVFDKGQSWKLVCVRTDKTEANDMLTYQKTKLNGQEKITVEEICEILASSSS
jgi:hypothetical protein